MHISRTKLFSAVSAVALLGLALLPQTAHAGTSITGTWTGATFGNSAFVSLTGDLDLLNPTFDNGAGGGKAHSWWFSSGAFSNLVVNVTGSAAPVANGTFNTASFNWLRIYSDASTSANALTDSTYIMDLGASGLDLAPSDSGGYGVMQVGSGGGFGFESVSWNGPATPSSVTPELPGAMQLLPALLPVALIGARKRFKKA